MACFQDVSSFLKYEIDKYFVVSVTSHGKCENLYKWKMRYELQKSLNYILNKKKTYDSLMKFRHENDELGEIIDYLYGIETFSDWIPFVLHPNVHDLFEKYNFVPMFPVSKTFEQYIVSYIESFDMVEKKYCEGKYYFLDKNGRMMDLQNNKTLFYTQLPLELSKCKNFQTLFYPNKLKGILVPVEKKNFLLKLFYVYKFFLMLEH